MGMYSNKGFQTHESVKDTTTSAGISMAANSVANTKGTTYTTLIASTAYDATKVIITISSASATLRTESLIDIAIGAAASEVVKFPDLIYDYHAVTSQGDACVYEFDINIPKGTRLSALAQSTTASFDFEINIELWGGNPDHVGYDNVTAYGVVAATSTGTSVDAGAVANTLGAWAQLTASTANPIRGGMIGVGRGGNAGTAVANYLFSVGDGTNTFIGGVRVSTNTNEQIMPPSHAIYKEIPAGTNLQMQTQSNITDATDRVLAFIIYGVH